MLNTVKIGRVCATHGVRGALVLRLLNDNSRSLQIKSKIFFQDQARGIDEMTIVSINYGNKVIAKISGLESLDDAKSYVGKSVYVDKDYLKAEMHDSEFLLNDLLGYIVVSSDFFDLGEIESFYSNGIQDIAVTKDGKGNLRDVLLISNFIDRIDNLERKVYLIKTRDFYE